MAIVIKVIAKNCRWCSADDHAQPTSQIVWGSYQRGDEPLSREMKSFAPTLVSHRLSGNGLNRFFDSVLANCSQHLIALSQKIISQLIVYVTTANVLNVPWFRCWNRKMLNSSQTILISWQKPLFNCTCPNVSISSIGVAGAGDGAGGNGMTVGGRFSGGNFKMKIILLRLILRERNRYH